MMKKIKGYFKELSGFVIGTTIGMIIAAIIFKTNYFELWYGCMVGAMCMLGIKFDPKKYE